MNAMKVTLKLKIQAMKNLQDVEQKRKTHKSNEHQLKYSLQNLVDNGRQKNLSREKFQLLIFYEQRSGIGPQAADIQTPKEAFQLLITQEMVALFWLKKLTDEHIYS